MLDAIEVEIKGESYRLQWLMAGVIAGGALFFAGVLFGQFVVG